IGIELWRRAAPRALAHLLHSLGMVVIGILLGLPTLIMIIQFKSGIDRAPVVFPKIPFHSWIWMFIPFYWGDVLPPSNLVSAMPLHARVYIGVIPLAFAITALIFSKKAESKIWMGLAASLFAITMGLPPFTYLFYIVMPGVYLDHTRILFVASLLLAVCAGLGMDCVLRVRKARIF